MPSTNTFARPPDSETGKCPIDPLNTSGMLDHNAKAVEEATDPQPRAQSHELVHLELLDQAAEDLTLVHMSEMCGSLASCLQVECD